MHTKQTELAKTGRWSLKGPKPGKEAFFTPDFHITCIIRNFIKQKQGTPLSSSVSQLQKSGCVSKINSIQHLPFCNNKKSHDSFAVQQFVLGLMFGFIYPLCRVSNASGKGSVSK